MMPHETLVNRKLQRHPVNVAHAERFHRAAHFGHARVGHRVARLEGVVVTHINDVADIAAPVYRENPVFHDMGIVDMGRSISSRNFNEFRCHLDRSQRGHVCLFPCLRATPARYARHHATEHRHAAHQALCSLFITRLLIP